MKEVVLLHLLAATAGASFGLLVIWAAIGRSPWLLRFALVAAVIGCLIPVPAFDVAVGAVSQALVVAVPLWLTRRSEVAPGATAASQPDTANGRLRFTMSGLLRATLLIASVFVVAAYMPTEERRSCWQYALMGTGFGVATLAGAWAGSSHRRWWIRLVGLCVVFPAAGGCIVVPLAGGSWWGATLGVGFLVAAWICLARRSALLPEPCDVTRPTVNGQRHSRIFPPGLGRAAIGVLSLAMLLLPIAAYCDMLHAVPTPIEPPPEPNAYDDVLRIAKIVSRGASLSSASDSTGEPEASSSQRGDTLFDELHAALRRPSAVPIRYQVGYENLDDDLVLRQLSFRLYADGRQQRLEKRSSDARRTYLDLLKLGLVAARGGFVVQRIDGTSFTELGIDGLRQLCDALSSDDRRALIAALQAHEAAWEPFAKVRARELAALDRTLGWRSRITFVVPSDFQPGIQICEEEVDRTRSAKLRLLVCHLAISQYQADHGCLPTALADLVPDYIDRVPADPFSDQPLIYKATQPGYLLYSVDQDGRDQGGRGPSSIDHDLFLDPVEAEAR